MGIKNKKLFIKMIYGLLYIIGLVILGFIKSEYCLIGLISTILALKIDKMKEN
jgi:hypothetical protein